MNVRIKCVSFTSVNQTKLSTWKYIFQKSSGGDIIAIIIGHILLLHSLLNLSFPVCVSDPQMFFSPHPPFHLPPVIFSSSLSTSCLLSFPDLQGSESHLCAVLSTLHCVQSALRRQNNDVFHLWALRSSVSSSDFVGFFSWKVEWMFLTVLWKPWRTHSHQIQLAV